MLTKNHLEKALIIGFYFLLLTPLFFQQSLMHPLITLKTVVFQVVIEILAAVYICLAIFYKEYRPRFTPITISLFILLVAMLLSAIFGVNFYRSFWSVPERMTGMFLWLHLGAFFLMLSGLSKKINWVKYFSCSTVVSFLAALFPVVQLIFPGVFFDKITSRLSGTIGNPIFLSIYLLFHLFIGLWLASHFYKNKNHLKAGLFAVIAGFNLIVILLTQTRGAFLGLFAGLIFLLFAFAFKSFLNKKKYLVISLLAVLLSVSVFFVATRNTFSFWQSAPLINRFVGADLGVGPRFFAWETSVKAFAEKPVFGWGWENFYYAFNSHYQPYLLKYGFGETYFDKPHNGYLEFLSNTGLLGALAYLFLLFVVFRATAKLKEEKFFVQALLIGYLVHNFFAFDTLTSYLMFFVVLAFVDRRHENIEESKSNNLWLWPTLLVFLIMSFALVYFVNYRLWQANHWEYLALNNFVQDRGAEGLPYFNAALDAPSVYSNHVKSDLGGSMLSFLKQGVAIPDGQKLVRRSMEELKKVAEREPLHYLYHLSLADAANTAYVMDASYLDLAEAELKIADKLSPNRQGTLYVLSKIRHLKGDKDGGLEAMKKAIELAPEVADPHFYYGMLLLDSKKNKEALDELRLAKNLGKIPTKPDEARLLGGYFADAEDYENAIYYFQKALDLNPKDKEAKVKLGLTYYFAGKFDLAKKFIGEVIRTEDLTNSPQYEALKPILEELGFRKIIEAQPQ